MYSIYKKYGYCLGLFLGLLVTMSCTKMNETYHGFWKGGERTYPASPDSLRAFSGRDRIQLQWLNMGDPTLVKAVIYWNNKTDSVVIPIEKGQPDGNDTMNVFINSLPEGAYSFDIYTYDKFGNSSVVSNIIGKVYGNTYARSLLTRLVENNALLDDTLRIQWGDPADATSIGTEVVYTNKDGKQVHRMVAPGADTTVLPGYDEHVSRYFKYRTLFLPDSTAIDTFYTDYDSVRVLGSRLNLSKDGWTVTASSYDNRNGRTDRLPEMAIDENTSTSWVNLVNSSQYPHELLIDMQTVQSDIYGLSLYTGGTAENPATMNVYVSNDNLNWQPFGLMSIAKSNGWQYFDFSQPAQFRYLKLVFESSYGSANIILFEAGVFTR